MLSQKLRRSLALKLQDIYGYAQIASGRDTGSFDLRADKLVDRLQAYIAATSVAQRYNEQVESFLEDQRIQDVIATLYFVPPDELTDSSDLHRSSLGLIDEVRGSAEELRIDPRTSKLLD